MKMSSLAIVTFFLITGPASSTAQKSRDFNRTADLPGDGTVIIETYKGSITVTTWEKPSVSIAATIEADGTSSEQDEFVKETEIRVNESHDQIRIESDYDRIKHRHTRSFLGLFNVDNYTLPFVHYRISMPKTARLEINDYKSDTHVDGLRAHLRLETYKGTVDVKNFEGSVSLETYKGEVHLGLVRLSGESRLETGKGSIEVAFAPSAGCMLAMNLGRHADLESDVETVVRHKRHDDEEYRSEIAGGGPVLNIETDRGTVRLRKL